MTISEIISEIERVCDDPALSPLIAELHIQLVKNALRGDSGGSESLTKENEALKQEVERLKMVNEALQQANQKPGREPDRENKEEHTILVFMLANPDPHTDQIAELLQLTAEGTKYFLERLRADDFIMPQDTIRHGRYWRLLQKARKYLAERGLLK